MKLFSIFKKKAAVTQSTQAKDNIIIAQHKTYSCARCKKALTDEETTWVGNHRFCARCATPSSDDKPGKPSKSELEQSTLLFKHESRYCDDRDFEHYSATEYYLSEKRIIIEKHTSWVIDCHSVSNNRHLETCLYLSFEDFNAIIRARNRPEEQQYLGISKENCEQYLSKSPCV